MPQVEISIGGRKFDVACQDGEEHFLHAAAKMLDEEAQNISAQVGRMPESRMLLMAGLMLADKTASLEDKVQSTEAQVARLQARLEAGGDSADAAPSDDVRAMLTAIAERAEAVAAATTSDS